MMIQLKTCHDQHRWVFILGVFAAMTLLEGCRATPVTGRRQLVLIPEAREIELGAAAYQDALAGEVLSTHPQHVQIVQRVGYRLATAAQRPDYQWEFRVISSPTQNAFCLPGGKVAIYDGILPICEYESGLAVVMAHEVAHALARHGGERMSQGILVDSAGRVLSVVTQNQETAQRDYLQRVFGLTTRYGVILPYSRRHESEADHIGIMLMAAAGYDPRAAPRFWERFSQVQGGPSLPTYVSTHPSDAQRAADLNQLLPEALAVYTQTPERIGDGERIQLYSAAPAISQSERPTRYITAYAPET